MRRKLIYLLLIMVTAFAAACHEFVEPEINDVLDDSRLISVNLSQAQTKITNEDIDQQRFVVYIYVDGEVVPEFQNNPYNLVYDGDQKRWRFQKSGNWVDLFWNETGEHQFYAYNDKQYTNLYWDSDVSYNWNGGNPIINLGDIDLTDGSNKYSFDLIYTKVVHDVESKGYGSITLPFSHAFSSLLFEVKNSYSEEKTIDAVSLLDLKATSNSEIYLSFTNGVDTQNSGTETYSGGGLTIAPGESAIAFGGSVLAWPQGFWGNGPSVRLTVNGKNKLIYLKGDLGISGLDKGRMYHSTITLTPMNLDLEVKELVREYVGGALKSKLTLSLSADKDLSEISDLQITVNKKGGVSLGTYPITVISNEVVVEGVADMEEGYYTISYSFKDGIGHQYNASFDYTAKTPRPAQQHYIYADGSQGNDVEGKDIVGVIIYHGNPKEKFNDPDLPDQYCNGLAISTKNVMTSWGGPSAVSNQPEDAKVAISVNDIPNTNGGYTIKNVWANNNFNLPIYNNTSYADLSSCNTSGWYLGTKNEWSYIHSNLPEINTLLTAAGADAIQTDTSESTTSTSRNTIWMPFWCVAAGKSYYAVTGYFDYYGNLKFAYNYNYSYSRIARPIFAF